tara:strand:+ start:632 stop:778 length:147 start_codon:yes stop_codon:yes gene_type:complete
MMNDDKQSVNHSSNQSLKQSSNQAISQSVNHKYKAKKEGAEAPSILGV